MSLQLFPSIIKKRAHFEGRTYLNYHLNPTDYEDIIRFAVSISQPSDNIRYTIQHELAFTFGHEKSIFWYSDDYGNLTNPVIQGLNDQMLYDYTSTFSQYDLLHPKKNRHNFQQKRALRIWDLVTPLEYEQSTFYLSFMKKYGFYDEMVVSIENNGKCVGVIGLPKKKK